MTGYARKFDENATMSFKAKVKQLSENYNKIWAKVEKSMKIDSESKRVYCDDDKYIKTEIKIYAGSMITIICLSIIMLDSVIKANTNYYPQTLLEECLYVQEKIKIENLIDDDLEKSKSDSDFNDETESDNDNDE